MEHVHISVSNTLRNVPNAKCFHIFIYIYEYILEVYIFPIQSLLNGWKHLALGTLLSFVGGGHCFGNGSRAPLILSSGKPLSTGFGYTFHPWTEQYVNSLYLVTDWLPLKRLPPRGNLQREMLGPLLQFAYWEWTTQWIWSVFRDKIPGVNGWVRAISGFQPGNPEKT